MSRSQTKDQPAPLDPISEWRAWQALSIIYTVLLNRQIQRRWLLEQQCMADCPITQRFRPLLFLEPIPTLHRPVPGPITTPSSKCISPKCNPNQAYNPYNAATLAILREKVHLLRARVEKGKELASEIERRMVSPRIRFPTHFCYTCVGDEGVEVLLTKCGHRVCRTCLEFGIEGGVYECSICFLPAEFVARSPLGPLRSCSEEVSATVSNGVGSVVRREKDSRRLKSASGVGCLGSSSSSSGGDHGDCGNGGKYKSGHSVRFSCPNV